MHDIISRFNPRARVGRDAHGIDVGALSMEFQSTRPRGARPSNGEHHAQPDRSFNPRARVGRDETHRDVAVAAAVSIHAPAWGATPRVGSLSRHAKVSIHAPAWGATTVEEVNDSHGTGFNPRARVGRDRGHDRLPSHCQPVSIHAPAWGATACAPSRINTRHRFNPRARVGRDVPRALTVDGVARFNPRARVGRDAIGSGIGRHMIRFQSTRPRGARHVEPVAFLAARLFQSTRPRGARHLGFTNLGDGPLVSIHAPAWGATCPQRMLIRHATFQSTRPRGARLETSVTTVRNFLFQSTRPRGARHGKAMRIKLSDIVSIHAPAWGATRSWACSHCSGHVSIHAPAWGATPSTSRARATPKVSIHAPAWGATWSTRPR